MQAGAWPFYGVEPRPPAGPDSLVSLIVLLIVFQLVLRPGIALS